MSNAMMTCLQRWKKSCTLVVPNLLFKFLGEVDAFEGVEQMN